MCVIAKIVVLINNDIDRVCKQDRRQRTYVLLLPLSVLPLVLLRLMVSLVLLRLRLRLRMGHCELLKKQLYPGYTAALNSAATTLLVRCCVCLWCLSAAAGGGSWPVAELQDRHSSGLNVWLLVVAGTCTEKQQHQLHNRSSLQVSAVRPPGRAQKTTGFQN